MTACSEPVSWLRLERFHLGELAPAEANSISGHVATCAACRENLRSIEDDSRFLPPLPEVAAPAPRWSRLWVPALAAAAVAMVVAVLPRGAPPSRVAWKGGELAVQLVREREGVTMTGATAFRDGDRFKVLLTSPPGEVQVDVVVFQGEVVAWPLARATASGHNAEPLPGAFALTGPGDVTVCALAGALPERGEVTAVDGISGHAEAVACTDLRWVP